jgi:hypothetical protein
MGWIIRLIKDWLHNRRYNTKRAEQFGRKDGRECIPRWDDPHQPSYVMELVQAADRDIREIHERWHNLDASLGTRVQQLFDVIRHANQEVQSARTALQQANEAYRRHRGSNPPAGGETRLMLYWLLLFALFVFEFPINLVVFRLFGESELYTVIATAAIGVSLLVCAHYLGRLVAEGNWTGDRFFFAIGLIATPLLVIAAVAWLRQMYLSLHPSAFRGTQSAGMMYAFATFNLLIFLVATIAAYFVHDELLFNVFRARRQLAKAERKLLAARKAYAAAAIRRWKAWAAAYKRALQIKDIAQQLIGVYQVRTCVCVPIATTHHHSSSQGVFAGQSTVSFSRCLNQFQQEAPEKADDALRRVVEHLNRKPLRRLTIMRVDNRAMRSRRSLLRDAQPLILVAVALAVWASGLLTSCGSKPKTSCNRRPCSMFLEALLRRANAICTTLRNMCWTSCRGGDFLIADLITENPWLPEAIPSMKVPCI